MRIGIDLDGVCFDFAASLRHWLVTKHGADPDSLPEPLVWDFFKDQWQLTSTEFLAHCAEGVDGGVVFRHGDPFPDTVQALNALRQMGHTLHIVTHRTFGNRSVQNTSEWLTEHGLPYDTLTFSEDKTLLRLDAFIEDNAENYLALDAAGVRSFLIDRPWNHHLESARRVHSWWDFVREIEFMDEAEPESALAEAQRLVHGDRGIDYGHPADDFTRTGRMWGAILGRDDIHPALVGLCMAAVKISREVNHPKRDNRVDLAGYAETVQMVRERTG